MNSNQEHLYAHVKDSWGLHLSKKNLKTTGLIRMSCKVINNSHLSLVELMPESQQPVNQLLSWQPVAAAVTVRVERTSAATDDTYTA